MMFRAYLIVLALVLVGCAGQVPEYTPVGANGGTVSDLYPDEVSALVSAWNASEDENKDCAKSITWSEVEVLSLADAQARCNISDPGLAGCTPLPNGETQKIILVRERLYLERNTIIHEMAHAFSICALNDVDDKHENGVLWNTIVPSAQKALGLVPGHEGTI